VIFLIILSARALSAFVGVNPWLAGLLIGGIAILVLRKIGSWLRGRRRNKSIVETRKLRD